MTSQITRKASGDSRPQVVNMYLIGYDFPVFNIKTLKEFDDWLNGLKDSRTRIRLARRIERAGRGHLGDVAPVGENIHEMREFFGPGWRMYYIQQGDTLIVMLGGGEKSTQSKDISKAKRLPKSLEGRSRT
jgi:putative addiction module killer protein